MFKRFIELGHSNASTSRGQRRHQVFILTDEAAAVNYDPSFPHPNYRLENLLTKWTIRAPHVKTYSFSRIFNSSLLLLRCTITEPRVGSYPLQLPSEQRLL